MLYNDRGQLLRFQVDPSTLVDRIAVAHIGGSIMPESYRVGLVPVVSRDRLLFLCSSGRTADLPVDEIPLSRPEELQWDAAYSLNLRSMEELVAVLGITRLSWFSHGIQVSRFGYARKLAASYLQSFISSHNAGKGVKFDFDRVLALVLCNEEDLFVVVSKHGTALSLSAANIPISLDELLRFKVGDFLVAGFTLAAEQFLVAVTQAGVAYRQPAAWFQPGKPAERKTRSLGSEKSEAVLSLAGASAAGGEDWGILLREDGDLLAFKVEGISSRGTPLYPETEARALAMAIISRK
jgi:DNA gyrase/topoisomerase IV subunit A